MKGKMLMVITIGILSLFLLSFYIFKPSKDEEYKSDQGYQNFAELAANEVESEDYTIHFERKDSDVLLLAIHGGGIEPGTTELIKHLASENNYSYYSFNGIKMSGNQTMHITSTQYDEPEALNLVAESSITISFHGYKEEVKKHTYIGGLDKKLAKKMSEKLKEAGFSVSDSPKEFDGTKEGNIVNKNKQSKGVQLEISTAQREAFFKDKDLSASNRKHQEADFYEYLQAIEAALED